MVVYTKRIATKRIFHCFIVIDKEKFKSVGLWYLTSFLSVKISIPNNIQRGMVGQSDINQLRNSRDWHDMASSTKERDIDHRQKFGLKFWGNKPFVRMSECTVTSRLGRLSNRFPPTHTLNLYLVVGVHTK